MEVPNTQFVGRDCGTHIVVLLPKQRMTMREALIHAAWLVALADDEEEFDAILDAVRNT